MSDLLYVGLFLALLCLAGIIFALLQINRMMDYSRFKSHQQSSEDEDLGGIWTPLSRGQRKRLHEDRKRLNQSPIPDANLRADLPPGEQSSGKQAPGEQRSPEPFSTEAGAEPPPSRSSQPPSPQTGGRP